MTGPIRIGSAASVVENMRRTRWGAEEIREKKVAEHLVFKPNTVQVTASMQGAKPARLHGAET
jgi:hypothetical protein